MKRHVLIGTGAALLLLSLYAGVVTLAQGLEHALDQAVSLWYWIAALAVGFGVQAGLFSFLRQGLRGRQRAATASVVTSGGVSSGSMVACCAHHLGDVLPLLGLSGLAAFLANYQSLFLILGVVSNAVGIAIMLESIQRHGLSRWLERRRWDMVQVKKGTVVLAALLFFAASFTIIFRQ